MNTNEQKIIYLHQDMYFCTKTYLLSIIMAKSASGLMPIC